MQLLCVLQYERVSWPSKWSRQASIHELFVSHKLQRTLVHEMAFQRVSTRNGNVTVGCAVVEMLRLRLTSTCPWPDGVMQGQHRPTRSTATLPQPRTVLLVLYPNY